MTPSLQLSHSELKTFTQCRRKWALGYHWQWSPDPARDAPVGSRQLGINIHLALECYYGHNLDPLKVIQYLYSEAANARPDYIDDLLKEASLAELMIEGYLDWIGTEGIDAGLAILATESEERHQLFLPSGESVILRGHLDQLVKREFDGAILFRDFKTVGALAKADMLAIDSQMRFYALLQAMNAKDTGQRADGGLYTMLLRSKRTERAKGPFYEQAEVRYNRHDLNSTYLRTVEIVTEILRTKARLDAGEPHQQVVYPNPGDYCRWSCPFLAMCPLMDDGSRWQDMLQANFVQLEPYSYYGTDRVDQVTAAFASQ